MALCTQFLTARMVNEQLGIQRCWSRISLPDGLASITLPGGASRYPRAYIEVLVETTTPRPDAILAFNASPQGRFAFDGARQEFFWQVNILASGGLLTVTQIASLLEATETSVLSWIDSKRLPATMGRSGFAITAANLFEKCEWQLPGSDEG